MFYLTMHSTHYIYGRKEGNVLFNTLEIRNIERKSSFTEAVAPQRGKVVSFSAVLTPSRASRLGKLCFVSIYNQVSETPARVHSLWHGQ